MSSTVGQSSVLLGFSLNSVTFAFLDGGVLVWWWSSVLFSCIFCLTWEEFPIRVCVQFPNNIAFPLKVKSFQSEGMIIFHRNRFIVLGRFASTLLVMHQMERKKKVPNESGTAFILRPCCSSYDISACTYSQLRHALYPLLAVFIFKELRWECL